MPAPSIEIAWGGGKWNSGRRHAVQPHVETAMEIAATALDDHGVVFAEPVTATVWQTHSTYPFDGTCIDANNFELYLSCRDVRRRKIGRMTALLSTVSGHESIHCWRSEYFSEDTLLENAATEGLAYAFQEDMAKLVMTTDELAVWRWPTLPNWDEQMQRRLSAQMSADEPDYALGNEWLFDKWFAYPGPMQYPAGVSLGLLAVRNLQKEGLAYPDMVALPAEELLGVQ